MKILIAAALAGGFAFSGLCARAQTGSPSHRAQAQHASVNGNIMLTDDLYKLEMTVDPGFQYLGKFPFDIRGIAGGYRYLWGDLDRGRRLRRLLIVQVEGYYPDNDGIYKYGTPTAAVLGGEKYQHNVFLYDNDQYMRENPGTEADLTQRFLREHGYVWDSQLIMSRFARPVGEARKDEIIFFYFENLKDHSTKRVQDFPQDSKTEEQIKILESVDADSRKAFSLQPIQPERPPHKN